MISIEHPETEQPLAYSDRPDSKNNHPVGLHLATCRRCRKALAALSSLRQHGGWIGAEMTDGSDDMNQTLLDMMNDRLSPLTEAELRDRLKQNPTELKAALHFTRHHLAMQQKVQAPAGKEKSVSLWHRTGREIMQWLMLETARWKLAPLAIVLVAVVMIVDELSHQTGASTGHSLVLFDDRQTIQYVDQGAQPGIGFFATRKQSAIPFEGVSVQMINDRELSFSWPTIDNAKIYRLKLQVFKNGEMVVLGRVKSDSPAAIIKLSEPPGQYRYEWVLSGDTIEGQSFQSTGGFVVAR